MADKPMNYPPMSEEKLKKLQDYYENGTSFDGVPKKVQDHLLRVKQMGGGRNVVDFAYFDSYWLCRVWR
ncbi:hypothetical protein [Rubritalea tangerina]|uniref:Uncharacterized protein n=1 Tax=Rubritalea tangerina TaxID=430798 RepID=A0ABW4ZEL0_9BACT